MCRTQGKGVFIAVVLICAVPAIGCAQEVGVAAPPEHQTAPPPASPHGSAGEGADAGATPDNPAAPESRQSRRPDARTAAGRANFGGTLEERVAFYAKKLNLDARQQSELKRLLTEQREQVQRLWSDTTMPAAQRIQATKAIEDGTSDHIRAMLNEEQRKKYNPPRPPHDQLIEAQSISVEDWMRVLNARQSN